MPDAIPAPAPPATQPGQDPAAASTRVQALVATLGLQPHPEGGWYREIFRSPREVTPLADAAGRGPRSALTCIDFVLGPGQFSAWHRVRSDEAWHLLEGEGLRLWLLPPSLHGPVEIVALHAGHRRHVVPADWWQAAEVGAGYAHVGATVGPGFDFRDFSFGRDDPALRQALSREGAEAARWL